MQILVVEDDKKIANLLRRGLLEESYAVDIAPDGEEAIYKFEVNEYDLIVLDRMLPKVNGLQVCKTIRKSNTSIPIIMLTAKTGIGDRIEGLDSGADDYLAKPFIFNELAARIRALLRRGKVATSTVLTVDDLSLDPAAREVFRGGKEITLTTKEYALLEYLLRNEGMALTRSQIIEHVWDYDYEGMSNIVETYIKYLRKKLQVNEKSKPLIQTIRGYGYMLRKPKDV